MRRSSNFTERQKAQIWVRDRAHCCYTAKPLWLLDQHPCEIGIDWADHVRPAARGGRSDPANGRCASYQANYSRGVKRAPPVVLERGRPTEHWKDLDSRTRAAARKTLKRYAALHAGDWYFNRAVFRVWLAAAWLHDVHFELSRHKRDVGYYSSAALKSLAKWRRLSRGLPSMEQRKLVPARMRPHQVLYLGLREAQSKAEVRDIAHQLFTILRAATERRIRRHLAKKRR